MLAPDGKPFQRQQAMAKGVEAFDAGLAFVWSHRRRILQGGFIAGVIEIVLTYFQYFLRMSQQQVFLVLIAGVGSIAWLMTYIGIYCATVFRGGSISPGHLAVRAVQSMPKVILSYVVLVAVAMALFAFPPFLILAIFGIWAPAFCICEAFALPFKEPEEGPDDAFDDDVVYRKVIRFRFFQARPLWDLGFARSIAFTGQNFAISLQMTVFAWAVAVIPAGIMLLFAGYYPSFSSIMLEVLGSNLLQAMLLGVGMVSFVLLLPPEALAEIGLSPAPELLGRIPRDAVPKLLQLRNRRFAMLFIVALGIASTQLTWRWLKYQHTMPESVSVQLQSAEETKDRLIISLQLEDPQQLFRWLDPDSLRMKIVPTLGAEQAPAGSGSAATAASGVPAAQPSQAPAPSDDEKNLLEPDRVMPFTAEGRPLDENNFTPYSGPLRLVLYFSRPELPRGKFQLYHSSFFGLGKPIAEGEFAPRDAGEGNGKPT